MLFRRVACEGLAQNAYVLAHGGEALVVDPRRDVDDILALLAAEKVRATWVVATHVHADFVAGLHEVAAATGARIGLGERFRGRLPHTPLPDGHTLRVGDAEIDVLATPGHTLESVSFHVRARADAPPRLLSGDALFVGDVGRPDLAQGAGMAPAAMAELLHATLHERLAALPGEVEVWPAHGAGSACGSCIGGALSSTLAAERADNWAFRCVDRDAFVATLLRSLRPPPRHFTRLAAINHDGALPLGGLQAPPALDAAAVAQAVATGAVVLDCRSWTEFGRGHWPLAINIGLDGGEFEPWAGALLPADRPLVLHAASAARATEARRRLLRVGLDDVRGVTTALPERPARVPQLEAIDLFPPGGDVPFQVIDVRRAEEFAAGHVPGAIHVDLDAVMTLRGLDPARPTAVICEGGYRSSAAIAPLRAAGFTALHNVHDGMRGWRQNHLPLARTGPTATS
jgi:hydroxyacylglutathione hydrolase